MADAFRGLTIRLGADVRPLQSALSSISKSASLAQAQLRSIGKALTIDPTNFELLNAQLKLTKDKALLTAHSMSTVQTAISQATRETKELAGKTNNVFSEAQRLREAYNHVNAELETIYDSTIKVIQKTGDFNEDEAREYFIALRDGGKKAREELRKYVQEAASMTRVTEYFGMTKDQVNEFLSVYDKLIERHREYKTAKDAMEEAEGFKNAQYKAETLAVELKQAASEAVRLRSELQKTGYGAFNELIEKGKRLDAVVDETTISARAMAEAYENAPTSIQAAYAKLDAFQAAEAALNAKLQVTRERLAAIEKTEGFDKKIATSKDLYVRLSNVTNAATEMKYRIFELTEEVGKLETELREIEDNPFDRTKRSAEEVKQDIAKTNAELDEMRGKLKRVDKVMNQLNLGKEMREGRNETIKLEGELTQLSSIMSTLNAKRRIFSSIRTAGYGLYSTITPALLIAGRYAVQSAEEIDAAYRDMRKTVNGAEEDFEHLRDAAIEFSRTHITTASTILEIEAMGGQLGIAVQNLEAFATTVSNLDIATNMDSDQISEQLGKMASVIGIDVDEYDNFGDALVRLGNNLPVMESDIMTLTTRFMGMGKVVGMDADEMLGWAAAASATGQKAEAAGSSMQRFISRIETATVAASDEQKKYLEIYADLAGMTSGEFKKAFSEDASNAMYLVVEGLGELQKSGKSVNQVLSELGINNVRDKQLMEGLAVQCANAAEGSSILAQSLQMSSDAYHGFSTVMADGSIEKAGDAAREAQKKSEGFSGAIQIMRNNAEALANELSEGALPIIKSLSTMFQGVTAWVASIPDWGKTAVVAIGGVVAAIGPLMVAIGAVGSGALQVAEIMETFAKTRIWQTVTSDIGGVQKWFAGVGSAAAKNRPAISMFATALSKVPPAALALGAVAVVGGIIAIADAYQKANERLEKLNNAGRKLVDYTRNLGSSSKVMAKGFDTASLSAEKLKENLGRFLVYARESRESMIELYDSWQGRESDARSNAELIQYYSDVIFELAGSCDGSEGALMKLKEAIAAYNQLTGSDISIVDEETGAIDRNTEALEANTAAAQVNAYFKAYQSMYEDAIKAQAENNIKLEQTTQAWIDAKKAVDEYHKAGRYGSVESADLNGELQYEIDEDALAAEQLLAQTEGAMKDLTESSEHYENVVSALEDKFEEMGEAANDADMYSRKMRHSLDEYARVLGKTDGGMEEFLELAEKTTGNIDEFVQALSVAGVSAEDFQRIGVDAFKELYEGADGKIQAIGIELSLLNAAGIDPKKFEITDNGVLDKLHDKLWDLDMEAGTITDGEYIFKLTDDGIYKVKADLEDVDDTLEQLELGEYDVNVNGVELIDGSDDAKFFYELLGKIDEFEATPKIEVDNETANQELDKTQAKVDNLAGDYSINFHVSGLGSVPAGDIWDGLATGGMSSRMIRSIPMHASGSINGIVTRPTLTNVGLTGEAGDEAILHMRHAGGAIIPLSNRQHVRPFARAVASEMSYGGDTTIYQITIDGNTINDDPEIRAVVQDVIRVSSRRAAMNRG